MTWIANGEAVDLPRFFSDLVRCETRLYNALNARLQAAHGIAASQFEFLRYVREHPSCRVADLAVEFAVGIGATSRGVDRLERLGLVVRQANPADRRSSTLDLTAAGTELVGAAEATFADVLAQFLGPALAGEAGRAVAGVLAAVRAGLERDRVGMPAG